jgi:AraC family transcriptional regulator
MNDSLPRLQQPVATGATSASYRRRILRVQTYIQKHLYDDLNLQRLARLAHFSPFHFHRVFRALVGEGVGEYVRRIRLESAAVRLRGTSRTIAEIAIETGYSSAEAFSRAFQRQFQVPPSEFRDRFQHVETLWPQHGIATEATAQAEVRLVQLLEFSAVYVRHVGPYENIPQTFLAFADAVRSAGLSQPGRTRFFGIYWDDPDITPAEKLRYDCCLSLAEELPAGSGWTVQTISGGEYAVLRHVGPRLDLGRSYQWLYGIWLPASGRELADAPPFEIYYNSPVDTPANELVTEIHVPLVGLNSRRRLLK